MENFASTFEKRLQGAVKWSYTPYRPCMFQAGDITVTRIVPDEQSIYLEWINDSGSVCPMYKKHDDADFIQACMSDNGSALLTGLTKDTDYEFYLKTPDGQKKSRIRLARTGSYPGVIVNYLHPRDEAYAFSGRYLCSPSIVRQADGSLLASMDLFAPEAPQDMTLIYRSDDNGKSWHWQCDLFPCFWGKLFVYNGDTYVLACATEHGDILLGKSNDYGRSFESPTVLLRGSPGTKSPGVDMSPEPPIVYKGRIWINFHWGSWGAGIHYPCIASAPADSDILDAGSWTFTPCCPYNPDWEGTASGKSSGTLEGTFAVLPDDKLYMLARYGISKCIPDYGLALMYKVNTDDPAAPLEFSRTVKFDGNHSKFTVLRDPESGNYYSIVSYIRSSENKHDRNLLALMKSEDCINWKPVCYPIDFSDRPAQKFGLQYVDFIFDNDDIIFLCRTATNGADNFHNSNCITFHVIKNFRSL